MPFSAVFNFTPLPKGSINSIFGMGRNGQAVAPSYIPFPLPRVPQCVHQEITPDGTGLLRCDKVATPIGPNGFLCRYHQRILEPKVVKPALKTQEDLELEVAEGVIKTEQRALRGRQRIKIGKMVLLVQTPEERVKLDAARKALNRGYDTISFVPDELTQKDLS